MNERDKLPRKLISMFWEPGINYAVETYPDNPTEELLKQQEVWIKLNKAYQQGVKDVVEYIFDNYNLVEFPVKEKLKNLEEIDKNSLIKKFVTPESQKAWKDHFNSKDILTEEEQLKIRTNYVVSDSDMESLIGRAFNECNIILPKLDGSIDNTPQCLQMIKQILMDVCGDKIHIICDETNNSNYVIDHKIAIADIYYFYNNHIVSKELIFGDKQRILQYKTNLII